MNTVSMGDNIPSNNPRNSTLNEQQELFIRKYIEANLKELMLAFRIDDWFDLYKLKEIFFNDIRNILLKLKEEVSSIFWIYSIPWTYEALMSLPETKLWLIEFDFQFFSYKSLDEAVLIKAITERQLLNRIKLITRDILDNKFWRIFSTLEEDVAQIKHSYQFSMPYKLTDKWVQFFDEFLKLEWTSITKLLANAHAARTSYMRTNTPNQISSQLANAS